MKSNIIYKIERELSAEKKELDLIEDNIDQIKTTLLEKVPTKFSKRDIINAFFGSLILGMTFVLKGGAITVAMNLDLINVFLIILTTLTILFAEIYYIAYSRVRDRRIRRPGQFIMKRLTALYAITLLVTTGMIVVLNINNHPALENDSWNVFRLIILISFPCAIGAAVPSLLKKYIN